MEEIMKVLIVDDSMFMRTIIKEMLKNKNYTFLEASSPSEAIEIYKREHPQIVTMDVVMKTSGVECVKQLKNIDSNANIVMISSMNQKPIVYESIQSGAKDFIVKPFSKDKVLEVFNKLAV